MAVAIDHVQSMLKTPHDGLVEFPVGPEPQAENLSDVRHSVRSGLLEFLGTRADENLLVIQATGDGYDAGEQADLVVADLELLHLGEPGQVANDMLRACRDGGRVGLAVAAPGSFLAEIDACIDAHTGRGGRGFTGTRVALDALFGSSALALGARDRTVMIRSSSAEHWLARWQASYAPLHRAYRRVDPDWRRQFTAELLRIVNTFALPVPGGLLIPCDYLEFTILKGRVR